MDNKIVGYKGKVIYDAPVINTRLFDDEDHERILDGKRLRSDIQEDWDERKRKLMVKEWKKI